MNSQGAVKKKLTAQEKLKQGANRVRKFRSLRARDTERRGQAVFIRKARSRSPLAAAVAGGSDSSASEGPPPGQKNYSSSPSSASPPASPPSVRERESSPCERPPTAQINYSCSPSSASPPSSPAQLPAPSSPTRGHGAIARTTGDEDANLLEVFADALYGIKARCSVSDSALAQIHTIYYENLEELARLKASGKLPTRAKSFRRRALKSGPPIKMDVILEVQGGHGETETKANLTSVPRQLVKGRRVVKTKTSVELTSILREFKARHCCHEIPSAVIHTDHIPETKSGSHHFRVNKYVT